MGSLDYNINMLARKGMLPTQPMQIGKFSSSSATKGVKITRTQTAAYRVYADDRGVVLTGSGSVPDLRVTLARMLLTKDNSGGHIRVAGAMGHIKGYNAMWNTEQVAASYGYLELVRTSGTITLGGYGKSAAVVGCVENLGAVTVNTNHKLAGVMAISKLTSDLTQTGDTAGFLCSVYDTTNWSDGTARVPFKYGLLIESGSVATGGDIKLASGATISSGSGVPSHSAVQGSLYIRTGQAINAAIYINTDGSTGWTLANTIQA